MPGYDFHPHQEHRKRQQKKMREVKKELGPFARNGPWAAPAAGRDHRSMTPAQLFTLALYMSSTLPNGLPERPGTLPASPGAVREPGSEPQQRGGTGPQAEPSVTEPAVTEPAVAEAAASPGMLAALDAWAKGGWDPLPFPGAHGAPAAASGTGAGNVPPFDVDSIPLHVDPPSFLARHKHKVFRTALMSPVYSPQGETLRSTPWNTVERYAHHRRTRHPDICKVQWPDGDITRLRIRCDPPVTDDGRFLSYVHVSIGFKDGRAPLETIMPADGRWKSSTDVFSPGILNGHWKKTSDVTVSLLGSEHVDDTRWGTRFTPPPAPAVHVSVAGTTSGREVATRQPLPTYSPAEYSVYERAYLPFGMTTEYAKVGADPDGDTNGWEHLVDTTGIRIVKPVGATFHRRIAYTKTSGYDHQVDFTAAFPRTKDYDTVEIWVTPTQGSPFKVMDLAADGTTHRTVEVKSPRPISSVSAKPRQPAGNPWTIPDMEFRGRPNAFPVQSDPDFGLRHLNTKAGSSVKPHDIAFDPVPAPWYAIFSADTCRITVPSGRYDAALATVERSGYPGYDNIDRTAHPLIKAGTSLGVACPDKSTTTITPILWPGRYRPGPVAEFPTPPTPEGMTAVADGPGWTKSISLPRIIDEATGTTAPEALRFPEYVMRKENGAVRWPQICDVYLDPARPGFLMVGCDANGAFDTLQVELTEGGSYRIHERVQANGTVYAVQLPSNAPDPFGGDFSLTVTGCRSTSHAQQVSFPVPLKTMAEDSGSTFGAAVGAATRGADGGTIDPGGKNVILAAGSLASTVTVMTGDPSVPDALVSVGNTGVVMVNAARYGLQRSGAYVAADALGNAAPVLSLAVNIGSLVNSACKMDKGAIVLDVIAISGDIAVIVLTSMGVAAAPVAFVGLLFGLPAFFMSGSVSTGPMTDPELFSKALVDDTLPLIKAALVKAEEDTFDKFKQNLSGDFAPEALLTAFHQGWKGTAERITLKLLEQWEKSWMEWIDNLKPMPGQWIGHTWHQDTSRAGPNSMPHTDTLRKGLEKHGYFGWTSEGDVKALYRLLARSTMAQLRQNADVLTGGTGFSSDNVRLPDLGSFLS
ncbi:hypothetical protein ACIBEA_15335 [Streptomyces sp. NPDC051555]|uniref:hypothetical protein n=1 Tax=Streptomyces sp. NPDC051555 TaxID=3365657 RepID=UPI0037B12233